MKKSAIALPLSHCNPSQPATKPTMINPLQAKYTLIADHLKRPMRHRFRLTPIRLAMVCVALQSLGMAMPAVAATPVAPILPIVPTTTEGAVSDTMTQNNKTPPDNTVTQTTSTEAVPNNDGAPYRYQLPSQTSVKDHIAQQLDNRTLNEYNNFNQPVATLKGNKPKVGYDTSIAAKTDPADLITPASTVTTTVPDAKAVPTNAAQQKNQQQVLEQLSTENQTKDPYTTDSADPNAPTTTVSAQQNAANQTDNIDVNATINPNDYLPEYQQTTAAVAVPQQNQTLDANETPTFLKRLYNKVMNKGDSVNYIDITIVNADDKQQPAKNIKAALEQVTAASVVDFTPSIARLRQIATDAAEAVGYYDTQVSFRLLGGDNVEVKLNKVGEPVLVKDRVVDIRGEGVDGADSLSVYDAIEADIPPNVGDVFNHGVYKATKATIEGVATTNGFFDANWLDSSVDVILPDNTADINLVYDTKQRYHFGDIKVYSIGKDGKLTDNPDKLPIKPELLQQLMSYQSGDPYYQPFVTQFANNLSATRYFTGLDVDVILPSDTASTQGVSFSTVPSAADDKANTNTNNPLAQLIEPKGETVIVEDASTGNKSAATVDTAKQLPSNQVQNPNDIAPLEFSIDDSTQERLTAVASKAENLLNAPEDIQLAPEDTSKSRNPLVVIANAVSKVAKKIDKPDEDVLKLAQASQQNVINKMTPEEVAQQKVVPTYVVLNANKPREAQIGIGYETDVGVRFVGKLNNNLVNRNGLQGGVSVAVSKVDQAIEATASYPYKHPLNDKLTGSVGYQHKNVDDITNAFETDTVYANIARNIYRETGWNRTYSLRYRADKLALKEDKYDIEKLPYPFNNYDSDYTQQSLLLGYALSKTVADNVLTPTYGYSQRYSIEAGADGVLTDTNLAIAKAGVTGLYSFGDAKEHQVLGRLDLGYIYSDDFFHVPYRLRFFAGGDQSIRGYAQDSLGPRYGDQDFLIGGNALAVGSLEYNYQFRPGLRAAVFSDFGNAYDLDNEYENSTKVGVGVGVRYASPIGNVRLDVASGLSEGGDPYRIYFYIGSPL